MGKKYIINKKQVLKLRELIDLDGHIKDDPVISDRNGQNITSRNMTDKVVKMTRQPDEPAYPFTTGGYSGYYFLRYGEGEEKTKKLIENKENYKEYIIDNHTIRITTNSNKLSFLSPDEKKSFENSIDEFNNEVTNMVNFNILSVTDENVEWTGTLMQERLQFNYSLDNQNGCYISTNNLQLTDETITILNKLVMNYKKWSNVWSNILNNRRENK